MTTSPYYPYRSEAARDFCFAYFDSLAAKEWPIASEERTVPTAHGPTFIRTSGPPDAQPLVLLPGAATTSLMWVPNIQALSAQYRTFAVDQIGDFGRSTCTKPPRTMNDLVGWLNEFFDALELRGGINLVGISGGGALAAQYALHFPARLNKVVLLAPGNTVLRLRTEFWVRVTLAVIASRWFLPSFVRWIFADMTRKDPKWIDATLEGILINFRNLQMRKTPIPPVLTDAEWRGLQVPVLFLVGEHEVIYSAERAVHRLKRVAPMVRTEIVPGAGHDLTFAQAEMVNEKILGFLSEGPGASTTVADAIVS